MSSRIQQLKNLLDNLCVEIANAGTEDLFFLEEQKEETEKKLEKLQKAEKQKGKGRMGKYHYWHLVLEVNPKAGNTNLQEGQCITNNCKKEGKWLTFSEDDKDFVWYIKAKYLMRLSKELSVAQVMKKLKAKEPSLK